jgi:signal transduction histidine kinase
LSFTLDLRRIPAWLLVGVVLAAVLVGLAFVSRPQGIEGAIYIETAAVALENTAQRAIKNVALPHVWDDEKPPWQGTARYSLSLPPSSLLPSDAQWALYLPRVGARYRVWLGGQLIASEHWETPGYADTSVVPQLVMLPPGLLRQPLAANLLEIEVKGQLLRKSGLSQVILGEADALQARHARVTMWQVQATWMVGAASLLVALLCGLMWLQNRDKVFGLLAAASSAWALRLFLTPLVAPPMPFELWFYLHKLSFTVYCGFLYLFLWEIFEFRQGVARRLVVALLWLGPIWLAVTTLTENYSLYRIWTGVIMAVSVLTLLIMFRRARWGLDGNQRLMVVVGLATMISGVRDFAVVQLGMPGDGDIRWMTLGSLVFMLTLAWIMVQRTSNYMQKMGSQNQELEERVAQKEAELRHAFDSLREAEKRQVLETERERLTRDMHDGLGSQLVQTLNLVRSQTQTHMPQDADARQRSSQLETMLSHALEELRITLDSLEPMEGDLPAILGTLRQRLAPTLQAAGIELDWQVQEVPAVAVHGQPMESRSVMQLFRALQEIFANIIKHAQAKAVVVKTWASDDHVFLSVCDDGVGLGEGFREGGRGMQNLRSRAAALGAVLEITPNAHGEQAEAGDGLQKSQGTCVSLRFACLPASQAEAAEAAVAAKNAA